MRCQLYRHQCFYTSEFLGEGEWGTSNLKKFCLRSLLSMLFHIQICIEFEVFKLNFSLYCFNEWYIVHRLDIFTLCIVELQILQTSHIREECAYNYQPSQSWSMFDIIYVYCHDYFVCQLLKRKSKILLCSGVAMGCAGCAMHKGPWWSEGPMEAKILCFLK